MTKSEPLQVAQRYARRTDPGRYAFTDPSVWQSVHERQRQMLRLFVRLGWRDLSSLRVLEVGAGGGGNLLELLRMGFRPENLSGAELLAERAQAARHVLPATLRFHEGDASALDIPPESLDIVYQAVVFSSLLDDDFQAKLAAAMWRWVRPGGGVLWYDFVYDNPSNPDVRGVPLKRVRALFPGGTVSHRRVTLAPPIARRVVRLHPSLYSAFNALPLLRTHVLCWIAKE